MSIPSSSTAGMFSRPVEQYGCCFPSRVGNPERRTDRIDSWNFQFYVDGVTPSVAKVLEVVDRERVTVASSLGLRARTAMEWLSPGL